MRKALGVALFILGILAILGPCVLAFTGCQTTEGPGGWGHWSEVTVTNVDGTSTTTKTWEPMSATEMQAYLEVYSQAASVTIAQAQAVVAIVQQYENAKPEEKEDAWDKLVEAVGPAVAEGIKERIANAETGK